MFLSYRVEELSHLPKVFIHIMREAQTVAAPIEIPVKMILVRFQQVKCKKAKKLDFFKRICYTAYGKNARLRKSIWRDSGHSILRHRDSLRNAYAENSQEDIGFIPRGRNGGQNHEKQIY